MKALYRHNYYLAYSLEITTFHLTAFFVFSMHIWQEAFVSLVSLVHLNVLNCSFNWYDFCLGTSQIIANSRYGFFSLVTTHCCSALWSDRFLSYTFPVCIIHCIQTIIKDTIISNSQIKQMIISYVIDNRINKHIYVK